jgi:hypothetical protein
MTSRRKAGADVPVGDNERRRRLATEQVASMKHQSARAVFDYWNKKRGTRPAPERADIDPTEIRHALSDTFMLAADFVDQLRFRLAGTRVCALFGREIKGEAFAACGARPAASRSTTCSLSSPMKRPAPSQA